LNRYDVVDDRKANAAEGSSESICYTIWDQIAVALRGLPALVGLNSDRAAVGVRILSSEIADLGVSAAREQRRND